MSRPEAPEAGPTVKAEKTKPPKSYTIRIIIGYVLAAICLVWVFHDVDWKKFLQGIVAINWLWIPFAVIFDTFSYVCQGLRWHFLLQSHGSISVFRTTEAIYSGMFLNEILPLRVGEVARGYLVARWMSKPFVAIVPSMALERLMEGLWIVIAIGFAGLFIPMPRNLMRAGNILGAAVLAATALILYLTLRKKKLRPTTLPSTGRFGKMNQAIRALLRRLDFELRAIGISWNLAAAFGATFLMYAFQVVAYWLIIESYGIHISILSGAVVFLVVHIGTALPNAPANVGTYQFFCVVGLSFFGVEKSAATGFSVVVFILLTIPLWILGAIAFARSGLTLAHIRQKIPHLEAIGKAVVTKGIVEE